ncbi:hypothetical protein GQ457_09G018500 [Hibiscus cannabinus]
MEEYSYELDYVGHRGDANDQLSEAVLPSVPKRRATTATSSEFGRRTSPVWDHYQFIKLQDGLFAQCNCIMLFAWLVVAYCWLFLLLVG